MFPFKDIVSALSHIKGGIPLQRLSTKIRYGVHPSIFLGPSYKFVGLREYDDQRDSQKMIVESHYDPEDGVIFARKTVAEREVRIKFFADLSSSIDSGTDFIKRKMLLEAIGFVGITGARFQDPIGLSGFDNKIILDLPSRCGTNNFYHLLRTLYLFFNKNDENKKIKTRNTDFFVALDFISRTLNKPHFIPFVSDFVGFDKVVSSRLLRYVASRHELMFIFLDDPTEILSAAGVGYLKRRDIETGKEIVISRSRKKLEKIEEEIRERRTFLRNKLKRMGIYSVVIEPEKTSKRLHKFFIRRRKLI
ncbi:MAG: hypothetical protein COV30_02220 [Candidatus Yanofskybacteria bacterium CG10_big_fil_rev_8_21_14_0_10_37_15]|uniref:DUF58 domain-containing protein n=1 Tax=Candidatus Yanofskybacteria bacterium CG10_big_fil_rev_8_21_14_0_10_37_15 TaxID=1975097 RepID=A0A2H0R5G4_9BACT|nr:MAG: hypothetical protein COV30_02220 [Candidatus Yanofskybacteria bacterium CG10_big_fil_rev_8_21_14_0_10_37_15]